jgi:hypothetical protein
MEPEKRIIEINGIKLEVDLRHARRVDEFRIGDRVKVLIKEYQSYKSHAGVIVGFDAFEKLPTIIVAYLDIDHNKAELKYVYINASKGNEDVEICATTDSDLPFQKEDVLRRMDREIEKTKNEVADLQQKRDLFLARFGQYFATEAVLDEHVAKVTEDFES